jgi:hypothetical protein
MCDAGEVAAACDTIEALLGSPEWKGAERFLVADFLLLSARVYWRQQRYLRSIAASTRAFTTRPAMVARPIKPLLGWLRRA